MIVRLGYDIVSAIIVNICLHQKTALAQNNKFTKGVPHNADLLHGSRLYVFGQQYHVEDGNVTWEAGLRAK